MSVLEQQQQLDMQQQRHHRSGSAERDLVMDFPTAGEFSPADQIPLPPVRRQPGEAVYIEHLPPQKQFNQKTLSVPNNMISPHDHHHHQNQQQCDSHDTCDHTHTSTVSKDVLKSVHSHEQGKQSSEAPSLSDSLTATTPNGESKDMSMSIVSPPFTPMSSEIELARRPISPEPLKLPAQTAQLRAQLEGTLPKVFCESRARIPTTNGEEIFLHVYRNNVDQKEHLAIVFGHDIHSKTLFAEREGETENDRMTRGAYTGRLYPGRANSRPDSERADLQTTRPHDENSDVLCRIHSECYTGEIAWSARCDCGEQLDEAARLMAEAGRGVIVYLRQEGRGIGLGEKLKAYNLQDLGADTVTANLMLRHPADGRSFGLATAILLDLGLDHISLMTNNPDKIVAVEGKNKEITVTKRVPMIPLSWQKKGGFRSEEVDKYLATKIERMGHMIHK